VCLVLSGLFVVVGGILVSRWVRTLVVVLVVALAGSLVVGGATIVSLKHDLDETRAQVDDAQTTASDAESTASGLSDRVDSLESTVGDSSNVDDISSTVDDISSSVDDLDSRVTDVEDTTSCIDRYIRFSTYYTC
jgi:cell division protein FtsL